MADYNEVLDALAGGATRARMSRRRLLQAGLVAGGGVALSPWLSSLEGLRAFAAPPLTDADGVLVIITLDGGNDGMNTLAPVGNGTYHDLRGSLAIPESTALMVSQYQGLHPSFPRLKERFDQGKVAIIRGVGYTPADLSHFESMDIWMHGWGGSGTPHTGWLGRYIDRLPNAAAEPLYAVSLGWSSASHLQGTMTRGSGLPLDINGAFGINRNDASDKQMFGAVGSFGKEPTGLGPWADYTGQVEKNLMTLTKKIQPAYVGEVPEANLSRQLVLAARLINANLGIRVISASIGGFDTHADQALGHAQLLSEIDTAIADFYAALMPNWADNVALMTFSEFGRRPEANGDIGTDHGTSSAMFLIGDRVHGGLHGQYPSLDDLDRDGNLHTHVDFHSVYATVLNKWMRVDDAPILGKTYPQLDLFAAPPGTIPIGSRGYWIIQANGTNRAFGSALNLGSVGGLAKPVVGGDITKSGKGFWTVATDGGIFAFGDAKFHGSTGAMRLAKPIVGMAATPTGNGYWLVASDGGIFAFGGAKFHGSTGAMRLAKPIVGMAATPTGNGYWLVASDGGIFAFGGAKFHGSTGAMHLAKPIVGMATTPTGKGYWLVASDGGLFSFGDAKFYGSAAGHASAGVMGITPTTSGKGYWILATDGTVYAYGDAKYFGRGAAPARALLPSAS